MIDIRELLDASAAISLLPSVVEKDYALGWARAGIYAHTELRDTWIFKGGTCLKKCFFWALQGLLWVAQDVVVGAA